MRASCSMFSQVLKLIPRTDFERIAKETGAEYRSKGLSRWSQFVAMLFCRQGRAHSLREIEGGLKSCKGNPNLPYSSSLTSRRTNPPAVNSYRSPLMQMSSPTSPWQRSSTK